MTEPASKEDMALLAVRLENVEKSVKGMREQNSQEHGSLFTKMTYLTTVANWLKDSWRRFGILSPPPEEVAAPPKPPKDDTQ